MSERGIPETLTATRLREIADWVDTHDQLGESYLNLLDRLDKRGVSTGTTEVDRLVARDVLSGTEVQDVLRGWADWLDAQPADPQPAERALLDRVEAIIGSTDATVEVKAAAYIEEVRQWRLGEKTLPSSGRVTPTREDAERAVSRILFSDIIANRSGAIVDALVAAGYLQLAEEDQ